MTPYNAVRVLKNHLVIASPEERVYLYKKITALFQKYTPFSHEHPCSSVYWVHPGQITLFPGDNGFLDEKRTELLQRSLLSDGMIAPLLVTPPDEAGQLFLLDGYRRYQLFQQSRPLQVRLQGLLPVCEARMTSAQPVNACALRIRLNRARGVQTVEQLMEKVRFLSEKGWSQGRIGQELGMEEDEVLRLLQLSGLRHLFADHEFSQAWTTLS